MDLKTYWTTYNNKKMNTLPQIIHFFNEVCKVQESEVWHNVSEQEPKHGAPFPFIESKMVLKREVDLIEIKDLHSFPVRPIIKKKWKH